MNGGENLVAFVINDRDNGPVVEEITTQLIQQCRQTKGLNHFVLPKFAKNELCKLFGVKRITCFLIDFSPCTKLKDDLLKNWEQFNNLAETKPDLDKYRFAD